MTSKCIFLIWSLIDFSPFFLELFICLYLKTSSTRRMKRNDDFLNTNVCSISASNNLHQYTYARVKRCAGSMKSWTSLLDQSRGSSWLSVTMFWALNHIILEMTHIFLDEVFICLKAFPDNFRTGYLQVTLF